MLFWENMTYVKVFIMVSKFGVSATFNIAFIAAFTFHQCEYTACAQRTLEGRLSIQTKSLDGNFTIYSYHLTLRLMAYIRIPLGNAHVAL